MQEVLPFEFGTSGTFLLTHLALCLTYLRSQPWDIPFHDPQWNAQNLALPGFLLGPTKSYLWTPDITSMAGSPTPVSLTLEPLGPQVKNSILLETFIRARIRMHGLDLNIIKLEITPYFISNNRYLNKNTLMAISNKTSHYQRTL